MINRRSLLAAAGAASLVRPAAAAGQVVVTTWGGDYADLLTLNVEKPLLVPRGIEVLQDLNTADARRTKLTAERAQRRGSMDVVHLDDSGMYQMARLGVFEEVTPANVPNAVNIVGALKKPYAVPHIASAQVIVYNPEKVTTPPKSFADLLDPKYAGRVGLPDSAYSILLHAASLVGGGSMSNWEPGKKVMMDMKKLRPQLFPSNETLAAALKSGEVWLTPMWLAREFMWKKQGIKLDHAVPEEGAIPVVFEAAVPKNAQNKANAWAYLNAMLDAKAQVGFADRMGYGPTVTNAALSPDLLGQISFTPAQQAKFRLWDYDYTARINPDILDFWNKEFKA